MRHIILFLLLINYYFSLAQVSEKNIMKHIEVLASDSLQGRLVGSIGEKMSAEYIENQFKKFIFNTS